MDPSIQWPLTRNMIRQNKVSNTFGMVRLNPNGTPRPHQGWDFEAAIGTPCFAIAAGRIALISAVGDYGNLVALAFTFEGEDVYAAYAHLSAVEVTMNQQVAKGERIGLTGDSGNARGMTGRELHLHFEIRDQLRPGVA